MNEKENCNSVITLGRKSLVSKCAKKIHTFLQFSLQKVTFATAS